MKFLRNLLASILGGFIVIGIIVVIFFIATAASTEPLKDNSVLKINLDTEVKDFGGKFNFDSFSKNKGLNEILAAIVAAKTDSNIKGISLENNFLMTGMAQTEAIRNALEDFKSSGKFIYAYGDIFQHKDYYLASVADSVFMNPSGDIDFRGLSSEVLYYKDFEEKTGIKMEVIRHGKYKSAVEPYLANAMSDANREQISELLGSVWNSMLTEIAKSRNVTVEELNAVADSLSANSPEDAVSSHLIDKLAYGDQYEKSLKKAVGIASDSDLNSVSIQEYTDGINRKIVEGSGKDVAVIYAQGEIYYGEGSDDFIGQGMMLDALKDAVDDDDVKSIVLRVNSPGGSALASDIIWRAVVEAKKKKPVVVSMGDLAASGGYFISCGADKIYAEPTTITGSIGVFGTLPNIHELAQKWGINAEQVGTNKQSTGYSVFEPLSDNYRKETKKGIERTYKTFLTRVAEGRNMTVAAVDSIAQGRVWSGADAINIGLVDELGGLKDAIAEAAKLAGITDYGIKNYPEYDESFSGMIRTLVGAKVQTAKDEAIQDEIGVEGYQFLKSLKAMSQQKGVQARLPFQIAIQ
ncbi:signal peptide peptidase SppA [Zhouia sp. PK063]|uniref:signal peptide peptidase SppA n=1 Tax=Zhouia sp. PK063 TaxID=3373602 RepID=UPI0037B1FE31